MDDVKKLVIIGIKKKGESSFKIKTDPSVEPHIIQHKSGVKKCSTCGHPVNAPEGACVICEVCGQQFGGCG